MKNRFVVVALTSWCLVFTSAGAVLSLAGQALAAVAAKSHQAPPRAPELKSKVTEGPAVLTEIEVGPFDLRRKYPSMQGPYVVQPFRLDELVPTQRMVSPPEKVVYVEGSPDGAPGMASAPGMNSAPGMTGGVPTSADDGASGKHGKRELYWFKGIKLQVLDENGQVMPTAEFVCHLNIDVDPAWRNANYPKSQRIASNRVMTLTQGQTEFVFPEGFGVPIASDEKWTLTTQAANRTSDKRRLLKHVCSMIFVKDSDLKKPMKALCWWCPYIVVVAEKNSTEAQPIEHKAGMPDCIGMSAGEIAPNTTPWSTLKDSFGKTISAHWQVPPGTHTYATPVLEERDPGFAAEQRMIHAAWTHVHPLCEKASLVKCEGGGKRTEIFSVDIDTRRQGGLEITKIENLLSKQGIPLPPGAHYELVGTYVNDTGAVQDSMVSHGIFCADEKFVKPDWTRQDVAADPTAPSCGTGSDPSERYCGIKSGKQLLAANTGAAVTSAAAAATATANSKLMYPLFNPATDGPLLKSAKRVEIITSRGVIHVVLDPAMAPQHATQVFKLLTQGAFTGTPIVRYEPNFVLQTQTADVKVGGQPPLSNENRARLRCLPLEVSPFTPHKKGFLTMARDSDPNSAVTSFSFLLGDAPHLDHQYTVFGRLINDEETNRTLQQIFDHWGQEQPFIIVARELD